MPRYVLLARPWFGLTAVLAFLGVVVQVAATATGPATMATPSGSAATRVAMLLLFFTILSNLLLGVVTARLAAGRSAAGPLARVALLDAVVAIAVTGVVYHLVLAPIDHPHGLAAFANVLLHSASPLMGVAGWVLFGPRGLADRRTVVLTVLYPVAWLGFTLVRGAFAGWYPYPFVDVAALGYVRVAANCLVVAALFVGLAAGASALDGRLPGIPGSAAPPTLSAPDDQDRGEAA